MAVTQERNSEMIDLLSGEFQRRYEPNFAWGQVTSNHLQLPGLRAYYSMSSVSGAGNVIDICQGNTATNNNNCLFNNRDLAPYIEFTGANNLSAADSAWNQITGTETYINAAIRGITIMGWVYFGGAAAAIEQIFAKQNGAPAANLAYSLFRSAAGVLSFTFSDSLAIETISTTATLSASTWYHVAGSVDFNASTKSVYLNGVETSNATALAAINNLALTPIGIGARDNGAGGFTEYMTGRQSNVVLCAAALQDYTVKAIFDQSKSMFGVN